MDSILVSATPNHAAYAVRKGQMSKAIKFFLDVLGWVDTGRVTSGEWGEARFMLPFVGSPFSVQLTDEVERSDRPVTYPSAHFAINVDNARAAAEAIKIWAGIHEFQCHIEPANNEGSKWFVKINEIFTFQFELVSRPRCPRCKGKGTINGIHLCPDCEGSGANRSF